MLPDADVFLLSSVLSLLSSPFPAAAAAPAIAPSLSFLQS